MKIKFRCNWLNFSAWYLTPSVRVGIWHNRTGGFFGIAFLKFDACWVWSLGE